MGYEYNYDRPTLPGGGYASAKQLAKEAEAALPEKMFVLNFDGADCTFDFEEELSAGEETTLDGVVSEHAPQSNTRFEENFEVETVSQGKVAKVEWFQTDNGDGTYSDLARDVVYTYQGARLVSRVETSYYDDGSVASTEPETYWTTSSGQHVTKRN